MNKAFYLTCESHGLVRGSAASPGLIRPYSENVLNLRISCSLYPQKGLIKYMYSHARI